MSAHARLGASSAKRWMSCSGSARLSAGLPSPSSVYAAEGTEAHAIAERALREGKAAHELTDNAEMAEAVQVYLDCIRSELALGDHLWIEERVNLAAIGEPEMFGTADAIVFYREERLLRVYDYKHGAGIAVEALENPQLRYYGLGAFYSSLSGGEVDEVELVVVQPRAPHADGPIRRERISVLDLMLWAAELLAAAARTRELDAPLNAGAWCRFCTAAAICPALRQQAMATARLDFAPLPPEPAELSPAELGTILDKAAVIEDWLAAVRTHAHAALARGGSVPGWKLVGRRAHRKWANETAAHAALLAIGLGGPAIETRKLRSPAQVEKILRQAGGGFGLATFKELVVADSSGTTLAPSSDRRSAVLPSTAADDFVALSEHEDV